MKRTTDDIRRIYNELDAKCGVSTADITLKTSSHSRSRLGYCKYEKTRPVAIVISDIIMDGPDADFWDTILHEYAHALVKLRFPNEHHSHDAVWKDACLEIGCYPGRSAPVSREVVAACKQNRMESAKYVLKCDGCGHEWFYGKATKVIRNIQQGRSKKAGICPHCGGTQFSYTERRKPE